LAAKAFDDATGVDMEELFVSVGETDKNKIYIREKRQGREKNIKYYFLLLFLLRAILRFALRAALRAFKMLPAF